MPLNEFCTKGLRGLCSVPFRICAAHRRIFSGSPPLAIAQNAMQRRECRCRRAHAVRSGVRGRPPEPQVWAYAQDKAPPPPRPPRRGMWWWGIGAHGPRPTAHRPEAPLHRPVGAVLHHHKFGPEADDAELVRVAECAPRCTGGAQAAPRHSPRKSTRVTSLLTTARHSTGYPATTSRPSLAPHGYTLAAMRNPPPPLEHSYRSCWATIHCCRSSPAQPNPPPPCPAQPP